MDIWQFLEIFTLVTGIVYMVMQIYQGRLMWYFDILSVGSAIAINLHVHLWSNAGINLYYLIMAVTAIIYWRKFDRNQGIHIVRMKSRNLWASAAILIAGTPLLCWVMSLTDNPQPVLDGISAMLSIIGAWWLTCSYKENWYLWAVTDIICTVMFAIQGLWWMTLLYACYTISSFAGLWWWNKKGINVL